MDLTEEIRKIAEGIPAQLKEDRKGICLEWVVAERKSLLFDFGQVRRSIEAKTVEAGYRFVYSLVV